MKYEAKEITNERHYWIVVDENDAQVGEQYLDDTLAMWAAEDLTKGKKKLTEEESMDFTNGFFGEIEEAREYGTPISVPANAEEIIPVPAHVDDMIVSGQNEVGAIIEYRGEEWLVTSCYQESGAERRDIRDEMDEVPPAGWYSALFRVRTNHQAMQIVAEQVRAGQVQFTGPCTVKLADEQYTSDLRDLAYDAERGLHVRS